ncbi:hypothetical protein [Streptococcus vestibularis]|uniref:hypothetical protein n=1 Tax=Streptococcus vestibularis TaxID=1343 RepID=UPI0026EF6093|nr:hypothetical protein [Streptococcus vestibularis]
MKITLDEKTCLKNKLTLQEALIATAVSMGNYKSVFDNMINRHVLGIIGQSVDSKWKDIIKNLIDAEDARFETLAIKVQECFPKQKMMYANGTASPFYFRCNKTEIKNKLKKFLTIYGDVSDEDIIDATKRYVASYASKGYRGMRLAKYFIMKDDRKLMADDEIHVEEISDLATFLENKTEDTPSDIVDGDDWLMNSRN